MEWALNTVIALAVLYIAARMALAYFFPKDTT